MDDDRPCSTYLLLILQASLYFLSVLQAFLKVDKTLYFQHSALLEHLHLQKAFRGKENKSFFIGLVQITLNTYCESSHKTRTSG